jgi:hypothetical protein
MINSMVEFLLYTQAVGSSNLSSSTPRSSNGRTLDFGSGYRSSNLRRGAQARVVEWQTYAYMV